MARNLVPRLEREVLYLTLESDSLLWVLYLAGRSRVLGRYFTQTEAVEVADQIALALGGLTVTRTTNRRS